MFQYFHPVSKTFRKKNRAEIIVLLAGTTLLTHTDDQMLLDFCTSQTEPTIAFQHGGTFRGFLPLTITTSVFTFLTFRIVREEELLWFLL